MGRRVMNCCDELCAWTSTLRTGAQLVVHNPSGFTVGLENLQLDVFVGNDGVKAGKGTLISGYTHVVPAHSNGVGRLWCQR